MSKVRLRYSGLVNYITIALSLFTGFAFSVMVTRRLKVEEYGLWSVISSLAAILCYPHLLYGYWVTRSIARGVKDAVKTGLYLSLIFVLSLTPLYALTSVLYVFMLGQHTTIYFLLGLLYFYCVYFWYYWGSVTKGLAPELWGYGLIVGEVIKVSTGYLLLVVLRIGLIGVIFTLIISFTAMNSVVLIGIKGFNALSSSCKISSLLIRRWLKNLWIPLIDLMSNTLLSSEQLVISAISGTVIPSAFLQVSRVTTLPISYGSALASGLYARLLAKVRVEDLKEVLRMIFSINNFALVTELILSVPILSLFNPKYVEGTHVVILLAITAYFDVLIQVFNTTLTGIEAVDIKEETSFRDLLHSYLVKSPLVITLRNFSAIVLSALLLGTNLFLEPPNQAAAMASSWLMTSIPTLTILAIMVKRELSDFMPWKELGLSFLANLPVITYYLLLRVYEVRVQVFSRDFITLLSHILVAGIVYVVVMLLVSEWFRNLFISVLNYLRRYRRKLSL